MLLRTGGVKLLDFGIAKANDVLFDGSDGHTATGRVKGKLSYLSPEQVRDESLDARSDIFSLGVVLWECLTGKRLFYDKADYHTMNNVLERPVPPPSTQRPEVPPELDVIAIRALERNRDRRYQDAKLLADDLDHYLTEARFRPGVLAQMLDELFGSEPGNEIESIPAAEVSAPEVPTGSVLSPLISTGNSENLPVIDLGTLKVPAARAASCPPLRDGPSTLPPMFGKRPRRRRPPACPGGWPPGPRRACWSTAPRGPWCWRRSPAACCCGPPGRQRPRTMPGRRSRYPCASNPTRPERPCTAPMARCWATPPCRCRYTVPSADSRSPCASQASRMHARR